MPTDLDHYYHRAIDAVEQADKAVAAEERAKWLAIAREYLALIRRAQGRRESRSAEAIGHDKKRSV